MPGKQHHEALYRGADSLDLVREAHVVLCGAGAVGSMLADHLTRLGFARLRVIDKDRIEEHNVGTQLYGEQDVGGWKVEVLRNQIFRATGVEIEAERKELTSGNARKLLKGAGVVVDAFDNRAARMAVQEEVRSKGQACLHIGLYEDYAEVIWDETYRVPRDIDGDVCEYPLARNLVLLAISIGAETLMNHLIEGRRDNWTATLKDFAIRTMESDRAAEEQG